jgi:hypothetical protein
MLSVNIITDFDEIFTFRKPFRAFFENILTSFLILSCIIKSRNKDLRGGEKMSYEVGRINNGLIPSGGHGRVHAPGLEGRMENQDARISQGVANGSLSEEELGSINGEQADYEQMLQDFKANDGRVGPRERMQLNKELNGISGLIYADKHN